MIGQKKSLNSNNRFIIWQVIPIIALPPIPNMKYFSVESFLWAKYSFSTLRLLECFAPLLWTTRYTCGSCQRKITLVILIKSYRFWLSWIFNIRNISLETPLPSHMLSYKIVRNDLKIYILPVFTWFSGGIHVDRGKSICWEVSSFVIRD